ncbi:MAG TPA: response regulator [Anaerolineae bacterium]|nr:response regulator [Anaerolineae bacterium]
MIRPSMHRAANILIVDDTLPNLRLLSDMLQKHGYIIRGVTNGVMALTAVKAEPPDLILLDIKMPQMDGYTVCAQLKEDAETRDIPIIFISALDDSIDKVRAFAVGGVDYITKPFQIEEVLARVQTQLNMAGLRQQLAIQNSQLEQVVAQRTQTLAETVTQLEHEIAERKAMEKAMRQAHKLESLGVLAGGIAHDFNNMLTGIMMEMSVALLKADPTSATYEHLEKAINITDQAQLLTRQLLAYSGKENFEMMALDLNEIINNNLSFLHAATPNRITLDIDLTTEPMLTEANAGQLQQVVMNLVINAAEAYEEEMGSVYIRTFVTRVAEQAGVSLVGNQSLLAGDYVCLQVRDEASGISPENLSKIFQPFFTTKYSGRGLGLSAILDIIREHRGGLALDSVVGRGTTFTVYLPIAVIAEEADEKMSEPAKKIESAQVLLVDDEAVIRLTLSEMFEMKGIGVIEAADGEEGVAQFKEKWQNIDVVVMDMTMPHMDGAEALAQMRQYSTTTPVIILSGYGQSQAMDQIENKEHVYFMKKPFKFEQLMRQITEILVG